MNNYTHVIDWDKVNDIKDVIEILKAMDIKIDVTKVNKRLRPYLTPIGIHFKSLGHSDIEL